LKKDPPRSPPIASFRRIAAVTLALAAIGAVVGAGMGAVGLWGLSIAIRNPHSIELIAPAAGFGAILGFALAPIAAWTLMRHVPLWRAILETALGTMVGVAVGLYFSRSRVYAALWPLGLGVAGFIAAAIRLRLTHRAPRRAVSGPDSPSV
jgi:hypothetical protein